MRLGISVLIALVLGAFAAHFVLADRGYVLVNFRGYVIEMSVPGLVLALIALYFLVRLLIMIANAPSRWRAARHERRLLRSGSDLTQGLIHVTEGQWARGERLLTQGLKGSEAPLVNYLLAARAAHLQGATARRDEWLALAAETSADGATSARLTQADLELESGDAKAAIATLEHVDSQGPAGPAAAALLARAYAALDDSAALAALLPRLGTAALPLDERAELVARALRAELAGVALTQDRLAKALNALPSELRGAPSVVAARARALQRLGRGVEAEREVRSALKRSWHPALVQAYGEVRAADGAKQLKQAETWLTAHSEDADLLLAAARLCMAIELWGKARSYLESSLAIAPSPDAYALYGDLLGKLGEAERALGAFRSGLALASPAAAEAALPSTLVLAPPPRAAEVKK